MSHLILGRLICKCLNSSAICVLRAVHVNIKTDIEIVGFFLQNHPPQIIALMMLHSQLRLEYNMDALGRAVMVAATSNA